MFVLMYGLLEDQVMKDIRSFMKYIKKNAMHNRRSIVKQIKSKSMQNEERDAMPRKPLQQILNVTCRAFALLQSDPYSGQPSAIPLVSEHPLKLRR